MYQEKMYQEKRNQEKVNRTLRECCVELTSCKLVSFGEQKQEFLPQWEAGTGSCCVGIARVSSRAWQWAGSLLLFIINYLLFTGHPHAAWNENSAVC